MKKMKERRIKKDSTGSDKDISGKSIQNYESYTWKASLLYLILVIIFSCILVLPEYSIDLYGRMWGSGGFSSYQFLFKSKKVIPFLGTALLVTLGVWLALQATNWAWCKCFGRVSIKVHILIKRINFDVKIKKGLGGAWRLVVVCLYGVIAVGIFTKYAPPMADAQLGRDLSPSPWYEDNVLVAHAGGGNPDGYAYVNSLEAFEKNYQLGLRVFEGDMCLTSDGVLVLEHDWEHYCIKLGIEYNGEAPTYEQFMNSKFYGTDTPMDIRMLMELMVKHKDMYFMTDYKSAVEDVVVLGFQQIVQTAKEMNSKDVLERFIIQNYHNDFKHWVDSIYPFQNWVYTLYMLPEPQIDPEEIVRYCEAENIPVITMWTDWINEDWLSLTEPRNMKIYVHTENDVDAANQLIQHGASGIYTDFLRNEQIEATRK